MRPPNPFEADDALRAALSDAWRQLMAALAVDAEQARPVLDGLLEAYSARTRFYHTLVHVRDVLSEIDSIAHRARALPALRLAAWFHDVVYAPGQTDNEDASAEFAAHALAPLGLPAATLDTVAALIRATRDPDPPEVSIDVAIFLDAYLAVLGYPPDLYDAYSHAIRMEYGRLPDTVYIPGRRGVLSRFLARPSIYRTCEFFDHCEAAARANINRQLRAMPTP